MDKLRDRMIAYLSQHRVCIISAAGPEGARAMPVRYRHHGLEVDCLLPRWADVTYCLERDPRVALVIQDFPLPQGGGRWLRCLGTARPVQDPDWAGLLPEGTPPGVPPEALYLAIRVTPTRIDLVDETQGWGARETWEA